MKKKKKRYKEIFLRYKTSISQQHLNNEPQFFFCIKEKTSYTIINEAI